MLLLRLAAALMLLLLLAVRPGFAEDWPPGAADLSVTLANANGGCLEGEDCRLALQIENLGGAAYRGGLRITVETSSPSLPGIVRSGKWTCERGAYGRFTCRILSVELQPAGTLNSLLAVRFLPTPMGEAEVCAAIDWNGATGDPARDAMRAAAAALGAKAPPAQSNGKLLSLVFGIWGRGDLRAGNDRGCVLARLGRFAPAAVCADGEERISGRCVATEIYCSGNRERQASGVCACPKTAESFDPVSRVCAASAALVCDGGRSAKDGLCFCPEPVPLWNAASARCATWREAQPKHVAEDEEPPPPPPPARKPKPKAKPQAKKSDPPVAEKLAAKPEKKRATPVKRVRVASRIADKPQPRRRFRLPKCPIVFAFCWPQRIREARLRRARAQRR